MSEVFSRKRRARGCDTFMISGFIDCNKNVEYHQPGPTVILSHRLKRLSFRWHATIRALRHVYQAPSPRQKRWAFWHWCNLVGSCSEGTAEGEGVQGGVWGGLSLRRVCGGGRGWRGQNLPGSMPARSSCPPHHPSPPLPTLPPSMPMSPWHAPRSAHMICYSLWCRSSGEGEVVKKSGKRGGWRGEKTVNTTCLSDAR